ncbi:MAG: hypothetical protein OEW19_07160 [Acidobacteriota bacterium]|nr:hypothetical protein [Acidobacteriota bacterium]
MTTDTYQSPESVSGLQKLGTIAAMVGLGLAAVGFAMSGLERFYQAYLVAYTFWLGVALGSMALLMVQHLSGGAWGVVIRRPLEAAVSTMPAMAVLFLPIIPGMHDLYHWTHADALSDPVIAAKAPYLNTPFFLARAAFYFLVWIGISQLLLKWSKEQDQTGDPAYASKLGYLSGGGLVVYTLTVTFAITDWLMSVNPHWFSTMWGPLFMVGQGLGALAVAINVLVLLGKSGPMDRVLNPSHFHDIGKLLFAFLMLWAYLTFSQFLIVYSANLVEEVPHYIARSQGGYQYVTIALIFLHFIVPYSILLSRDVKRDTTRLRTVAAGLLLMRLVDHYWQVAPEYHEVLSVSVVDVALPIAIGGIFLTLYAMRLKSQPLLPLQDAGLEKALTHHVH